MRVIDGAPIKFIRRSGANWQGLWTAGYRLRRRDGGKGERNAGHPIDPSRERGQRLDGVASQTHASTSNERSDGHGLVSLTDTISTESQAKCGERSQRFAEKFGPLFTRGSLH